MLDVKSGRAENGFTTVEWMVAVAFSLLTLVVLVNLVAIQYGRGVLRAAADDGARAGARVAADPKDPGAQESLLEACRQREASLMSGLGTMASSTQHDCEIVDGQYVKAVVSARFAGWLPLVPDVVSTATATSVSEQTQAPV